MPEVIRILQISSPVPNILPVPVISVAVPYTTGNISRNPICHHARTPSRRYNRCTSTQHALLPVCVCARARDLEDKQLVPWKHPCCTPRQASLLRTEASLLHTAPTCCRCAASFKVSSKQANPPTGTPVQTYLNIPLIKFVNRVQSCPSNTRTVKREPSTQTRQPSTVKPTHMPHDATRLLTPQHP